MVALAVAHHAGGPQGGPPYKKPSCERSRPGESRNQMRPILRWGEVAVSALIPCSATDIDSLEVDFDEPALPREAEESNNDDVCQGIRKVMKVPPEVLNILFSDDICFRCKGDDWSIVSWCDECGAPLCRDCGDTEVGLPTFCGLGRCPFSLQSSQG